MTSIVGIRCQDGVVIGADSSATSSAIIPGGSLPTIELQTDKIKIIDRKIIIAGSGSVGFGQRFSSIIENAWNNKLFSEWAKQEDLQSEELSIGCNISRLSIVNFLHSNPAPEFSPLKNPINYGALVAFYINHDFHLCEFEYGNLQPEFKTKKMWFVSMGCAQQITDPFLALMKRVFWKEDLPKLHDGIFAVTWTLQHAIEVNTGGVNGPIQIAILEKDKKDSFSARMLEKDELGQHLQNIEEAEKYLSQFPEKHRMQNTPSPPQKT